jgi:hypothetical protein
MVLCFVNHTKHMHALCEQNADVMSPLWVHFTQTSCKERKNNKKEAKRTSIITQLALVFKG